MHEGNYNAKAPAALTLPLPTFYLAAPFWIESVKRELIVPPLFTMILHVLLLLKE